jgi:hypothetical protein
MDRIGRLASPARTFKLDYVAGAEGIPRAGEKFCAAGGEERLSARRSLSER